jgi:uncharacterized protein
MPFRIKPRHYLPSLLLVAFIALLPILFQESYIYHPRPYEVADLDRAKALGVKAIRYKTSQGNQTAFLYQTEDTATPPTTLWIMFSGNGSVALDWFALPWSCKDPQTAFLLVDYPSYGFCEGKPNPETILENSEKAIQRLCELKSWKLGRDQLAVLGHSIGGAAALQFAAAHPVKTIVVFSTFTSMADMVQEVTLIRLDWFLRHKFDNVARLKTILSQNPVPEIYIFHGDRDGVIPFTMGKNLHQIDPDRIHFSKVAGADHNDVIQKAVSNKLLEALGK